MSDPSSTTRPQGTPVQPRSWLPAIAGAAAFFAIFGGLAWWFHHSNKTDTEPVAEAIDEDNDPATMTEAEPVDEPDAEEVEPEEASVSEPEPTSEPVAEAAPEPTPAAAPVTPSAAPVVASPAPAAAPAVDPTNCTFVNGNRPMVGDKYVLTCAQGEYIAKGEYLGGGVFAFSAYEPHTP